ncbi:MAG: DUF1295 domain-containing protein [Candidatus Thorarchaeota archaeon]
MNEYFIFYIILISFGLSSLVFFIVLLYVTAGYGQHLSRKWGPTINNKLGWFIMEVPTVIVYFHYFIIGNRTLELVPLTFLFIWMLHYCQRTFVFPLLIRGKQPMPITIILFGIIFNCLNAYLQARWIYTLSPDYLVSWIINPIFITGIVIFFCGFIINLHSDHIVRNLRQPGENEYKIPYGGMFRYISSPSYFGEITEWTGWAIMTWSFPGLIFALWTFANLAPRARSNHIWYIKNFEDYPKNRKVLIPFIY